MLTKIDARELRNAFSKFPTGVTIVTTVESNGTPRGLTANSFTSVSLDPPLLLVCINNSAASLPVFLEGRGFAINILAQSQKETSGLFATQRADKFEITPWHNGEFGMPLIDNAVAWFECTVENHVEAGDHVILIGRIIDFNHHDDQPLGYVSGGYFSLGLEQTLVDVASKARHVRINLVLEQEGELLLKHDERTGKFSVPGIGMENTPPSLQSLINELCSETLTLSIEFLYAVYEDQKSGMNVICYRGKAQGAAPDGMGFYSFDDIPWNNLADEPTHSMLRRYVDETRFGKFAVYMGDDVEGEVRTLE